MMLNSPELWIAAGTLWVLDALLNVSMQLQRHQPGIVVKHVIAP